MYHFDTVRRLPPACDIFATGEGGVALTHHTQRLYKTHLKGE